MKKQITLKLCLLIASILIYGCNEDPIVYPTPEAGVEESYLTLDQVIDVKVELADAMGTYLLRVKSPEKWNLVSSESWLKLSTNNGYKYTQIELSFEQNPKDEARLSQLAFSPVEGDARYVVQVEQAAAKSNATLNKTELAFSLKGGDLPVNLSTNAVEWSAKVVDTQGEEVDWASVSPISGSGSQLLTVSADPNTSGSILNASLIVVANTANVTIPIVQDYEFTAPVIDLKSDDTFELNWKSIIGVKRYELIVASDPEFVNIVNKLTELPAEMSSYDLNTLEYNSEDGYVGNIYAKLVAYMQVGEVEMKTESNEVSDHNYFDVLSGTGDVGSEFIVTKPRHLKNISLFLDKHYKQTTDIDMSGVEFVPIHSASETVGDNYMGLFTGSYDAGKGRVVDAESGRTEEQYKISNLSFSLLSKSFCGLFAQIGQNGVVKNLIMENPNMRAKQQLGAVVGRNKGTVLSCRTQGEIGRVLADGSGGAAPLSAVGGIAGECIDGKVIYCSNNIDVKSSSGGGLGGVIGSVFVEATNVLVDRCTNYKDLVMEKHSPMGGIVGNIGGVGANEFRATIQNCINIGDITNVLQNNNQTGGIVGRILHRSTIDACANEGDVLASGSAGGIVGRQGHKSQKISNCYNSGRVESAWNDVNFANASGIVSHLFNSIEISFEIVNCHNVGTIISSIAGENSGLFNKIHQPHASRLTKITVSGCRALNVDNSRQLAESDNFINNPSGYENISAEDMSQKSSFEGWDFDSVWEITNGKYPTLRDVVE